MTAGQLLGFYWPDLNLKNFMDINHILDMALLFDFRTSKSPLLIIQSTATSFLFRNHYIVQNPWISGPARVISGELLVKTEAVTSINMVFRYLLTVPKKYQVFSNVNDNYYYILSHFVSFLAIFFFFFYFCSYSFRIYQDWLIDSVYLCPIMLLPNSPVSWNWLTRQRSQWVNMRFWHLMLPNLSMKFFHVLKGILNK